MADEITIRERRIRQFEHYLDLMEYRTLRLIKSDCFLVFSTSAPRDIRPRIGGSKTLIVQFAFTRRNFYLDLPDTTLTYEQAKQAVSERFGFAFALERPLKRLGERRYDPVQRTYEYGQQRAAAEDAAYVFFDLWHFPPARSIKVDAAAFETKRRWERGFILGLRADAHDQGRGAGIGIGMPE